MDKIKRIPAWGMIALLVYMPFHILLSQSLSLATGGLEIWKVAKDALTLLLAVFAVLLVWQQRKSNRLFNILVVLSLVYGLLHLGVWALHPGNNPRTSILGSVYNNRLLWYLLIGFSAGLLVRGSALLERRIIKIILIVSTIVAVLGILQYFLPKDILTHLGYSIERGVKPNFFIDDKPDLPRVMSTLRDPNSLGAYLILPLSLLAYLFLDKTYLGRRRLLVGLFVLQGVALVLTFSRSAWLGALLSVVLVTVMSYRRAVGGFTKRYWPLIAAFVVGFGLMAFALRDNYVVQNVILHSDESTVAELDSNDLHLLYAQRAATAIVAEPGGYGPGTAGLVSIQNPNGGFLTENYYLQIGYEVGVIGLLLFIAVQVIICWQLWKSKSRLAIVLLASFAGYVVVNMLLHIWTNETVAAWWWLVAGLAICAKNRN